MKLDALDHPKTLDFAARLNVTRPTAIGHLELFWHFVAKHAPRGNIGKFPDGAISRAADWPGDPETFVFALLDSGFLDVSEEHRYLVHDWPEHCPNWVRAQLQKLKQTFYVVDSGSNDGTEDGSYEGTGEPSTRARVSKGRDLKGREGKPYQGKGEASAPVDNGDNSDPQRTAVESSGSKPGSLNGEDAPPSEPSNHRNGSRERRNADFESINEAVSKLLASGACKPGEYSTIARLAHVSTLQAEVAVRQLRDRGQLPKANAA